MNNSNPVDFDVGRYACECECVGGGQVVVEDGAEAEVRRPSPEEVVGYDREPLMV